jgi:hypothetical protein
VVITHHQPGSADHVFLHACRVSLSQQYHRVHHSVHHLKRNKKKTKCRKPFPKDLDSLPLQTKYEQSHSK